MAWSLDAPPHDPSRQILGESGEQTGWTLVVSPGPGTLVQEDHPDLGAVLVVAAALGWPSGDRTARVGVFGAGSSLQSFHVAFMMISVGGECIVHTAGRGRVVGIESGRRARGPADPLCLAAPHIHSWGAAGGPTLPLLFL